MRKNEPVIFFGSGPVAAQSLTLLAQHTNIEAVITKPTTVSEMTQAAPEGTPVHTVNTKAELDTLILQAQFNSTLGVLIDFGIIVSQVVIDSFKYGIINSHFSVLPQWRGADPISFAILSGQQTTGVSLMLIDQGMDTGKILVTKSIEIAAEETTPSLTTKLINLSDALLQEHISRYLSGDVTPRQQSHPDRATYSRKLSKNDGVIDWQKPADVIDREIRAFIEWPKSRTTLGGKDVIITKAHGIPGNSLDSQPGDIEQSLLGDGILMIETGNGRLCVDEVKPAGKKEMPVRAFLAGYKQFLQN